MNNYTIETIIGNITIVENENAIVEISLSAPNVENSTLTPLLLKTSNEIQEYLNGKRTRFTIPVNPLGTPFQKQVWEALVNTPYGTTKSYKEIAQEIGNEKASRAIGMACNKNPIMIVIPCHRILGSNGNLVGYAGGLDVKKKLLKTENDVHKNK